VGRQGGDLAFQAATAEPPMLRPELLAHLERATLPQMTQKKRRRFHGFSTLTLLPVLGRSLSGTCEFAFHGRHERRGVILRSGRAPSRSFIFHAAPAGRPRVAPLTARSAAYADGCSRSERPKSYKIRAQTLPDMLCRNAEKRYKITAHSSQACCCCAPLVEWLYVWSGLPIHCHGLLPQSTHTGVGDVLDVRGHGHACR
jgi:hypothetical protein